MDASDMSQPLNGSISKEQSELHMAEEESSRLLDLANTIQAQVTEIQKYLTNTQQPDPSFEGGGQSVDFNGVDDTRSSVLEKLTELKDLLLTPLELLRLQAPVNLLSYHAIDRFRIYQHIPVDGSKSYEELAWATMLPVKTLRRILRHSMSQRIFYEPKPGVVAHTQASRHLAENANARDYFGTVCQEVWPAATRTCDAIEKWPGSKEKDESGYYLAKGKTIYDTLAEDPVKQARYDSAMSAFSNDRSHSTQHIVDGYDWAALGNGTVVDVGGGIGTASRALAKAFPSLNLIVEDRPDVLVNVVVEDPDIKDRIKFIEHDFFQEQPVKDADLYFFRRVFMEWPDDKAVEIIKALKPALKEGALVQIQDFYVPAPGVSPLWQERQFRNSDLLALAIANAGQRELEEWQEIFKHAGPGFEFKGVRVVPGSDIAFIEAVWQGEKS